MLTGHSQQLLDLTKLPPANFQTLSTPQESRPLITTAFRFVECFIAFCTMIAF